MPPANAQGVDAAALWDHVLQREPLAGLGLLSRSMAHEFNNVLQLVYAAVRCIEACPPELAGQWCQAIRNAVDRGRTNITSLHPFLRDAGASPEPAAVDDLLRDWAVVLAHRLPHALLVPTLDEAGLVVQARRAPLLHALVLLTEHYLARSADGPGELPVRVGRGADGSVVLCLGDCGSPGTTCLPIEMEIARALLVAEGASVELGAAGAQLGFPATVVSADALEPEEADDASAPGSGRRATDETGTLDAMVVLLTDTDADALKCALEARGLDLLEGTLRDKGLLEDYAEELDAVLVYAPRAAAEAARATGAALQAGVRCVVAVLDSDAEPLLASDPRVRYLDASLPIATLIARLESILAATRTRR